MGETTLSARPRLDRGKCPARRLRRAGNMPAVLYGPEIEGGLALTLNTREIEKVLHTGAGGNVLVSLSLEGDDKTRTVMFKEISRHPLHGVLQHVDLIEIAMDHKISIDVPVHVVGTAEGAAFGGIVQQETRTLSIECLPNLIPDSLDVDVTPLGVGQSLHIKDIALPEGIEVLDDPEAAVVSVVAPTVEAEPKTAEEVEAELAGSFGEKGEEAAGEQGDEAEAGEG